MPELRIIKPFLITLSIIIFSTTGCYYDNKQELYPLASGTCDTSAVSYARDIAPIMNVYCSASGCHSAATASSGVQTDSYDHVKAAVTAGRFLGAIEFKSGYSAMPKGSPSKMSQCNLNKINAWINAKMPNN